jgi:hypothetical protein
MIRTVRAVWRPSARSGKATFRRTLTSLQTRRIHSEPGSRTRKEERI